MYDTNYPYLQHISRLDDAETMSIEDARAMTLAAVNKEFLNNTDEWRRMLLIEEMKNSLQK